MGYSSTWNKSDTNTPKSATPSPASKPDAAPAVCWSPTIAAAATVLIAFSPLNDPLSLNLGGALALASIFRANAEHHTGAHVVGAILFICFLGLSTLAAISKFSGGVKF